MAEHPLVNYLTHEGGSLFNPTADQPLPLLYVLGAWDGEEPITIPVEGMKCGSPEHAVSGDWRLRTDKPPAVRDIAGVRGGYSTKMWIKRDRSCDHRPSSRMPIPAGYR